MANLKGGVGKTTFSVLLAEAAADAGAEVLLVDADPQGSAMAWADAAAAEGSALRSTTVALPTSDLGRRIDAIAGGHDHVVVDTPPGDLSIVAAAVRQSDVVLVPSQTTLMDLDRVRATLDVASGAGKPAAVVLSRVRTGTRSFTGAREALDGAELPLLDAIVPQREAIAALYGTRPTTSQLLPFREVLDELEAALQPRG